MKLNLTRKFGDERFTHNTTFHSKDEAKSQATLLRERGYKVRIVKVKRNNDNAYETFKKQGKNYGRKK
jgi:hypothetical protein